ncbi:MAG: LLM class flavin-dependent oxidoreductase [Rhodospirillaceae bacterium]|jgi:alkanesulfonate monooxygenase SsuD/methylene tetrahydromethanopterin reductase-like flavin-dependent oxidoreductase (luciferase family)|nr:LLM class flavin-dependent oxidoreductase [Rhodospirillaceae bacterium]MBT5666635.1 LLM class flavin-dependent oxidoreductase [Rhodospirillaceae bacterium]MBT5809916.1 LLM class flavin-dependent oxidoreductase [Rhodospirillaceae bacterium]
MARKLEVGVFDHIEHIPGVSLEKLYRDRLNQIELFDKGGIYCYHLAEHHTPAVHSMAPSQNVFLSSVAQRTQRLRFGPCVYVLPLHHPLRLIEEVSMLDNLSSGRLEVGVGRGGVLEAYFWGQESDPDSNRERYEETLAILRKGLTNDSLTHEGRFYQFDDVPMRLHPKQKPHPPLWYMRNPETAAREGMNCVVVGSINDMEANVRRFHRVWDETQIGGLAAQADMKPKIGLVMHAVIAETEAEAIRVAEPAWEAYRYNLGTPRRLEAERRQLTQFIGRADSGDRRGNRPERHMAVEERRDLDEALAALSESERAERGQRRRAPGGINAGVMAGTPETIKPWLEEYLTTGANYLVMSFQWGDISHEDAVRSVKLWTEEVMPTLA